MNQLSLEDAQYVAHALALRMMSDKEPMPPFQTRYPGVLESCLSLPFQSAFGKPMYLRFTRKAAVLFYGVIKDHPFVNGNKRMAVTLTLVFFNINGYWLEVSPKELYEIACKVAESKPQNRQAILDILTQFFNRFKTTE